MSNKITPSACGSTSGVQPVAASSASVSRSTTSRLDAHVLAHAGEKILAVRSGPAGLRRDQPGAGDAAVAHLAAADPQRIERAARSRPRSVDRRR